MRHYRVTIQDVIEAHEQALRFGGLPGVRDWGLLESAIGRPFTGYYRPIERKVAALAESLTRNHGFADGNKRTAFLIVDLFLYRSGYRLESRRGDVRRELERLILQIVERHPRFDEIARWFKLRIRRR